MQIFVDMDGVLANFDAHHEAVFGVRADKVADNVDWSAVRAVEDFYLNIPPMADLPVLWAVLGKHSPIVLTGVPRAVEEAANNKRAWIRKHLGPDIEVWCCRSSEKSKFAFAGDLLIDDWEKYKHLWIGRNGLWITHRNADETIRELAALGVN